MTIAEFEQFLTDHPEVSYSFVKMDGECAQEVDGPEEADGLAFRVSGLPWYDNNEKNISYLPKDKTVEIQTDELLGMLTRGLKVEHITRITGYFTKVQSWNKGKLGELRDRYRNPGFEAQASSM